MPGLIDCLPEGVSLGQAPGCNGTTPPIMPSSLCPT